MRAGRECMAADDWAGAIRAYAQGLMEQPLLGMHYVANLERARSQYRQERQAINQQGPTHTQVVVAAAELSHNAAGRAYTLAQLHQHLGHPVALLGSHFPQWGRELWEPIRTAFEKPSCRCTASWPSTNPATWSRRLRWCCSTRLIWCI